MKKTTNKHPNCGKTSEGHDDCLGTLIGLMNACCGHGHGDDDVAYVQFIDGTTVHGDDARTIQAILKKKSVDYVCDPERYIDVRGESVTIKKNKIWEESMKCPKCKNTGFIGEGDNEEFCDVC